MNYRWPSSSELLHQHDGLSRLQCCVLEQYVKYISKTWLWSLEAEGGWEGSAGWIQVTEESLERFSLSSHWSAVGPQVISHLFNILVQRCVRRSQLWRCDICTDIQKETYSFLYTMCLQNLAKRTPTWASCAYLEALTVVQPYREKADNPL